MIVHLVVDLEVNPEQMTKESTCDVIEKLLMDAITDSSDFEVHHMRLLEVRLPKTMRVEEKYK